MVLQTQMYGGLLLRLVICFCLVVFAAANCVPEKCGLMNVSYPFWIKNSSCGLPDFHINCTKDKSTGMMTPFLHAFNHIDNLTMDYYKVTAINYTGHVIINSTSLRAESCLRNDTKLEVFQLPPDGPFTISMSNKFVVIGCTTFGTYKYGKWGEARCVSTCYPPNLQIDPPYCRYGCCEITLPDNWKWINFAGGGMFHLLNDTTNNYDRKCGFSTILEPSTFKVADNNTDLFWGDGKKADYGLRLNWGIGLQNCSIAISTANYSCSPNAGCIDSPSGRGYVCNCLPGYQGNGYSNGTGCTDVDECRNSSLNVCVRGWKGGICHNLAGAYNCSCAKGYIGDGFQNGTGCTASTNSNNPIIPASIGSVSSFVVVSVGACGLFWWLRRRRWQNFRIRSEKEITSEGRKNLKKFSETDLQRASDSYSHSKILGKGSFGTVYDGTLQDGRVAIKKTKSISEEFINEIIMLSHINHPNVVKLLGFCMKLKSPLLLLVYEMAPNGTLFDHLQSPDLAWEKRLQIAFESARAVAYMHDEAPQSNFHRHIKSSNILLDNDFTPKVADFGISLRGPFNELDTPQFNAGHQFKYKSNVYHFGVVLVELLTGKSATNSPNEILSAFHEGLLKEIKDGTGESKRTQKQKENMSILANRCLQMKGMERPSMREVVEQLDYIIKEWNGPEQPGICGDTTSESASTSSIPMWNMH